jgi:hypothetical protein
VEDILQQTPNVLRHPFVLTLVTAFFVNGLTRTWQDRQKALEVTTELVAEMSEATTDALVALDRAINALKPRTIDQTADRTLLRPPSESGAERRAHAAKLQEANGTWERRSAVLGTKLEAYFPSKRAIREARPQIAKKWTKFSETVRNMMSEGYITNASEEQQGAKLDELKGVKAALIRLVLAARPAGFDRGWLPWRISLRVLHIRLLRLRRGPRVDTDRDELEDR